MPQLLAIAEYTTKTHTICRKCGQSANYLSAPLNQRNASGASDKYEVRCRTCFVPHADAPTVHD
jgi:thymidine kinase